MNNKEKLKVKVGLLALTLQGGLIAPAIAQDDDSVAYKGPRNVVGAGGAVVTKKSPKFGEFTGLNKSRVIGLFDLNGGNGLDLAGGTTLWNFTGSDLGTKSRALEANFSNQGKWKIGASFDQLKHYVSENFETPFIKDGNNHTLPTSFGSINVASGQPGTNSLNTTQKAAFHKEEVATERRTLGVNGAYSILPNLELAFGASRLDQTGNRIMTVAGFTSEANIPGTAVKIRSRNNNVLLNPTEWTTDTFNADLTWFLDKGSVNLGYYGSVFNNKYNSVNWQTSLANGNASACVGTNCFWNQNISTAPDNNFHQLNLNGAYRFADKTKVNGNFSYGINRQKDDYMPTTLLQPNGVLTSSIMQAGGLPVTSLDGKVHVMHGDVKVVNTTFDKFTLGAGVRFDERRNKTATKSYSFYYPANGATTSTAHTAANNAFSHRKWKTDVSTDYRITNMQSVRLFLEREDIKRWCGSLSGSPCLPSEKGNENTAGASYKLKATENLIFDMGYSYAKRNSKIGDFVTSNQIENGDNKVGFVAAPFGSRIRHTGKAGTSWQLSDALDMGLTANYTRDNHYQALGIQGAYSGSVNFDVGYALNENLNIGAFSTLTRAKRGLRLAQGSPGGATTDNARIFTNDLYDRGTTLGLTAEQTKLLDGKMDIGFEASYTLDKTHYNSTLQHTPSTACSVNFACGDTEEIRSEVLTIKLNDTYAINERNSVGLEYMYQKRNSVDFFYNGLQYPFTIPTLMPSNEVAPSYTNNLIAVTYNYRF